MGEGGGVPFLCSIPCPPRIQKFFAFWSSSSIPSQSSCVAWRVARRLPPPPRPPGLGPVGSETAGGQAGRRVEFGFG